MNRYQIDYGRLQCNLSNARNIIESAPERNQQVMPSGANRLDQIYNAQGYVTGGSNSHLIKHCTVQHKQLNSTTSKDARVKIVNLNSTEIAYIIAKVFGTDTKCVVDIASESSFVSARLFYQNKDAINFVFLPQPRMAIFLGKTNS